MLIFGIPRNSSMFTCMVHDIQSVLTFGISYKFTSGFGSMIVDDRKTERESRNFMTGNEANESSDVITDNLIEWVFLQYEVN